MIEVMTGDNHDYGIFLAARSQYQHPHRCPSVLPPKGCKPAMTILGVVVLVVRLSGWMAIAALQPSPTHHPFNRSNLFNRLPLTPPLTAPPLCPPLPLCALRPPTERLQACYDHPWSRCSGREAIGLDGHSSLAAFPRPPPF